MITFARIDRTHTEVYRDGLYLGLIVRRSEMNSSPRGGAYRDYYYTPDKRSHYTRKEAVEHLLRKRP